MPQLASSRKTKSVVASHFRRQSPRLTRPKEQSLAFSPQRLAQLLGLDGGNKQRRTSSLHRELGDAQIDSRSGGAIGIRSSLYESQWHLPQSLSLDYYCLQPDGRLQQSRLVEIAFRKAGQNLAVKEITVLGRAINLHQPDKVMRVFGAIERIHTDLRQMAFPEIAKILHDFQLAGMIGERLLVPGMAITGGFDFKAVSAVHPAQKTEALPLDFMKLLLGIGANDYDGMYDFLPMQNKVGIDQQNAGLFECATHFKEKNGQASLKMGIKPLNGEGEKNFQSLFSVGWRQEGGKASLEQLDLCDEDSLLLGTEERQKRLGIINKSIKEMRQRRYPRFLDHLAEYDQRDLLDNRALLNHVSEDRQMIVIPFGGHNEREVIPGFGATIGGNCKGVFSYWKNAKGKIVRKGILIDLGIMFAKSDTVQETSHGNWDYLLPDVTAYLKDIEDIFITHTHADHLDGVLDYAARALLTGKTVHATAFVWRVLEQKLKKRKVPESRWPKKNVLDSNGMVHIDAGDERALSVFYAANAIPHSTDNTAYLVMPPPTRTVEKKEKRHIQSNPHYWVYGNFGDMSFGRFNAPGYKGPKPPDTGLQADMFKTFRKLSSLVYPQGGAAIVHLAEVDPTSIHRNGWAPDVVEVGAHRDQLQSIFSELGIIILGLSTGKRQDEADLRFAVNSGRNISIFGAYKEDRFTDMSVMGVNARVLPRNPEGKNVQAYLDWYAGKVGKVPVKYLRRTAKDWRETLLNDPSRALILGTGSQGTSIEKDAFGTQVAEFRSLLQRDPKYRPTAFGADLRQFIILYAQGAIPGNEDSQYAQIKKTAHDLDVMVGVSIHRGARFYNLKEPYYSRLTSMLDRQGKNYAREGKNGLFIADFPLYAPGHGWREDYRQGFFHLFKRYGVGMVAAQHFGRLESLHETYALAKEAGLKTPDTIVANHTAFTMQEVGRVFRLSGRVTQSYVLAHANRRADKYHGGTYEYKRVIIDSAKSSGSLDGLFANTNKIFTQDFGHADYDQAHHEARMLPPVRRRRDPDHAFTTVPHSLTLRKHLPTASMRIPALPRHPHLEVA